MKKYLAGLAILASAAWVGGMWIIGFVAAPVLFNFLPDKALAGMLAGRLFGVTAYVGMICSLFLIVYDYSLHGRGILRQKGFWMVASMLALVLLGNFGLQPLLAELKMLALPQYVMDSPYAGRFSFLHGTASLLYVLQCVLGAIFLLKKFDYKA